MADRGADITYQSLAVAFNQKLTLHQETLDRMREINKYKKWVTTLTPEQEAAVHRMAQFPEQAEILYVEKDIWVVRVFYGIKYTD